MSPFTVCAYVVPWALTMVILSFTLLICNIQLTSLMVMAELFNFAVTIVATTIAAGTGIIRCRNVSDDTVVFLVETKLELFFTGFKFCVIIYQNNFIHFKQNFIT